MAFEPIAAPAHSAAKRLWFNKALQQTGGAWLRALGDPVVRASSLRRRPQLNAVLD
jgi:hypothetical protein